MFLAIVSTIAYGPFGFPYIDILLVTIVDMCDADSREDIQRMTEIGLNVEMVNL